MKSNSWNCFGCLCVCPSAWHTFFTLIIKQLMPPDYLKWSHSLHKRMQITPIFPGFDRALHIQPNLVQVGPILDPDQTVPLGRLERANKELFDWMNEAQAAGEDIIYITLGSEVEWQQWYIDAFY